MEYIIEPRKHDECFFCPDLYQVYIVYEYQYRDCISNRSCEYIDQLMISDSFKMEYRNGVIENKNIIVIINCLNYLNKCGGFKFSFSLYHEDEKDNDVLFKKIIYDNGPIHIESNEETSILRHILNTIIIISIFFTISSLSYFNGNIYSYILILIGIICYFYLMNLFGRDLTLLGAFIGFNFGLISSIYYQYRFLLKKEETRKEYEVKVKKME